MKKAFFILLVFLPTVLLSQQKAGHLILVTLDGLRWQEVFGGMDSAIANNPKFNQQDSAYIFKKYWHPELDRRRELLMPFLWSVVKEKGQIWGNRKYGNRVDNANPHWFSYPGYSEMLTGFADSSINSNDFAANPHVTVLEFLNRQPSLRGKVAAFTAWDAFDRILNERRAGFPVVAAFDSAGGARPNAAERLINRLKWEAYRPFHDYECLDVFTHYAAFEHLRARRPRVLYIAYGETDEWAHAGQYRDYLNAAKQVDDWLRQLWNFVQSDPQYRNRTAMFVTVDHGRGDRVKEEWTSHNSKIADSHEIWFAVVGPGVRPGGEMKETTQIYQKQIAATLARLLGYRYRAAHPVANGIDEIFR